MGGPQPQDFAIGLPDYSRMLQKQKTQRHSTGWHILPDEIKLIIMEYATHYVYPIPKSSYRKAYRTRLAPFIGTPASAIAHEAFYSNNVFEFDLNANPRQSIPRRRRQLIRHVRVSVFGTKRGMQALRRFQQDLGIPILKSLHVTVYFDSGDGNPLKLLRYMENRRIHFNVPQFELKVEDGAYWRFRIPTNIWQARLFNASLMRSFLPETRVMLKESITGS